MPLGYSPFGWYGARVPLVSKTNPENLGELSETDVMNVLKIVRRDFNVDPDRVYLLGHSMGGAGAWHLSMKYPDQWAALAPIAPAVYHPPEGLERIKHIPVILIQGGRDWLVPVAGARRWAVRMKQLGMTFVYVEEASGGHDDVAFKNLPRVFEFFNRHSKDIARK